MACQPRPVRVDAEADAEADAVTAATMPDLVERGFIAGRPRCKFIGDITHSRGYRPGDATEIRARKDIIRYFEGLSSGRRRHSSLGYRRPNEVHHGFQPPAL